MNSKKKPFRVHIGCTAKGRDRWRYYGTLEAATAAVSAVFAKTGIVLSIVRTPV
jgi:hypothetical protein